MSDIDENKAVIERRLLIAQLTAELYNAIEVDEDEDIMIPDEILGEL